LDLLKDYDMGIDVDNSLLNDIDNIIGQLRLLKEKVTNSPKKKDIYRGQDIYGEKEAIDNHEKDEKPIEKNNFENYVNNNQNMNDKFNDDTFGNENTFENENIFENGDIFENKNNFERDDIFGNENTFEEDIFQEDYQSENFFEEDEEDIFGEANFFEEDYYEGNNFQIEEKIEKLHKLQNKRNDILRIF